MRRPGRSGFSLKIASSVLCTAHPRCAASSAPSAARPAACPADAPRSRCAAPGSRMHAPRPSPSPGNRRHLVRTEKLVGHRMRPFPSIRYTGTGTPAVVNMISSFAAVQIACAIAGWAACARSASAPRLRESCPAPAPAPPAADPATPSKGGGSSRRPPDLPSLPASYATLLRTRGLSISSAHTHRQFPPSQSKQFPCAHASHTRFPRFSRRRIKVSSANAFLLAADMRARTSGSAQRRRCPSERLFSIQSLLNRRRTAPAANYAWDSA